MLTRSNPQAIGRFLIGRGDEPPIPPAARKAYELGARTFRTARAERDLSIHGFDLRIELDPSLGASAVTHYEVIDEQRAITQARIDALTKDLQAAAIAGLERAKRDLDLSGVPPPVVSQWIESLAAGRDADVSWAPERARADLLQASRTVRAEYGRLQSEIMDIETKRSIVLPPSFDGRRLQIRTRPQAVHYLLFRRVS